MSRRLRSFTLFLLLLPVSYLVLAGLILFSQDYLIYQPSRLQPGQQELWAEEEGFEPWMNERGGRLGWKSKEGNEENVLLVFHGNGGSALNGTFFRYYSQRHSGNWKTYLLEYPGYGDRPGKSSEVSLTQAAVEAVDVLSSLPGRRIWLLGASLGSGTACATVRERADKIAGVLLLTPFDSLVNTAAHHYPWLPVSAFLRTRFDSVKNLADYSGPVAFIIATKDTVVPAALGRKLYDSFPGRKRLWIEPEKDHEVSPVLEKEWDSIVGWLQSGEQQISSRPR